MPRSQRNVSSVSRMWSSFNATRRISARNKLVMWYAAYATKIAFATRRRLPQCVSRDDLVSVAMMALISTVERFDESQNVKFETFSARRISGAILDHLRELDWVPRQARDRQKFLRDLRRSLDRTLCRPPTDDELMSAIPGSRRIARNTLHSDNIPFMLPLPTEKSQGRNSGSGAQHKELFLASNFADPASEANARMCYESALSSLDDFDRRILTLRLNGHTFTHIGRLLGIKSGRAYYLYTLAIQHAKMRLGAE